MEISTVIHFAPNFQIVPSLDPKEVHANFLTFHSLEKQYLEATFWQIRYSPTSALHHELPRGSHPRNMVQPPTPSTEHSTQTLDLTGDDGARSDVHTTSTTSNPRAAGAPVYNSAPSASLFGVRRPGHRTFRHAYHRLAARRDREYDARSSRLVRERLEVVPFDQDHAITQPHPLRAAYVAVGYAHAALTLVVCGTAGALVLAFARAVAADFGRKTRTAEAQLVSAAAECAHNLQQNGCSIDGAHVTHPASFELAVLCKQWAACASAGQYAATDSRSAKVWAEILADILNTFTSRLSLPTVAAAGAIAVVLAILCSSAAVRLYSRHFTNDADSLLIHNQQHAPAHTTSTLSPHRRHVQQNERFGWLDNRRTPNYIGYKSETQSSTSSAR